MLEELSGARGNRLLDHRKVVVMLEQLTDGLVESSLHELSEVGLRIVDRQPLSASRGKHVKIQHNVDACKVAEREKGGVALSRNGIGNKRMPALAKVLGLHPVLHHLDLSGNNLSFAGACHLAKASSRGASCAPCCWLVTTASGSTRSFLPGE